MQLNDYKEGILQGSRLILSKAITLIESRHPDHREKAQALIEALLPHTGEAVRLGISGVPGVGKSTFIESFGMHLIDQGHRVAVLAVDPSSQRSGGSILGDKTRMERLSTAPGAFIRPSPAGGTLGGVARMTRETMLLCEAAGFNVVIVETVGVGQSEAAVSAMVDFFLLLMITGAGDALQGIKKGILEMAHAVAINKADGENAQRAEKMRNELESALQLMLPTTTTWTPPVLTCSAATGYGLDGIWELIRTHREKLQAGGEMERLRRDQALHWMWSLIDEGLKERFQRHPEVRRQLPQMTAAVRAGRTAATHAARQLLFMLDKDCGDKKGM